MDVFRVITFQSPKVYRLMRSNGVYRTNRELCRERNDYSEDIKQLNGAQPIWLFDMTEIGDLTNPYNWLVTFAHEMSLSKDLFNGLIMLELIMPYDTVVVGKTRNSYMRALVTSELRYEYLVGVYEVCRKKPYTLPHIYEVTRLWLNHDLKSILSDALVTSDFEGTRFDESRFRLYLDEEYEPYKPSDIEQNNLGQSKIELLFLDERISVSVVDREEKRALQRAILFHKHLSKLRRTMNNVNRL